MGRASRGKRNRSGPPSRRRAELPATSAAPARGRQLGDELAKDPVIAGLIEAWNRLDAAAVGVIDNAKPIADFTRLGTDELAAAVSALASAREVEGEDGEPLVALDELEDGAWWVSRSCTTQVMSVRGLSFDELAFVGAVLMMRGELMNLKSAKGAAGGL